MRDAAGFGGSGGTQQHCQVSRPARTRDGERHGTLAIQSPDWASMHARPYPGNLDTDLHSRVGVWPSLYPLGIAPEGECRNHEITSGKYWEVNSRGLLVIVAQI